MNTLDVLTIIGKKNKDIQFFTFKSFPQQKLVQEQIVEWSEIEQCHFNKAIEIRNQLHLPFWDAVMVSTFNNSHYSEKIMRVALYHNHNKSIFQVTFEELEQILLSYKSNERIAVCSSVMMKDSNIRHIPMLDFHIPVCDTNLKIVEFVCKILDLGPGYILNSGESYHFISSNIVSWDKLYNILSKALRFCPIIDRAWISHQLEEKSCSLRVDKKNGIEPIVVKTIE